KEDETARDYELHLIGSLQRNKVRKVLPLVTAIHSVDTLELWETINRIAGDVTATHGSPIPTRVLIQVNTSGDQNKSGDSTASLPDFLEALPPAPHLDLVGFMTMGSAGGGPEAARPCLRQLAALLKAAQARLGDRYPHLSKLSMGM